jgi:hypothetical protein
VGMDSGLALRAPRNDENRKFSFGINLIPQSSPPRKNILLPSEAKSPAYSGRLIPHEGALAIVTNVGMGCGGREGARDERR